MPGQQLVVVPLGAEVQHGGREQSPLHARLDLQRRVGEEDLLELRDVAARVGLAAEVLRECAQHRALLGEEVQLRERALAVVGHAQARDATELRLRRAAAGGTADVGPTAHQQLAERRDIHGGLGQIDGAGVGLGDLGHGEYLQRCTSTVRRYSQTWECAVDGHQCGARMLR